MSQVIPSHLVKRDPSIVIDVLAPPSTISLLQRMPEVSRGIILKLGHGELGFGYRRRLGRRLANESYDHAIVTANSFKSSLVPFSLESLVELVFWESTGIFFSMISSCWTKPSYLR